MSGSACISYFYAPAADVLRLKRRRTSHPNGAVGRRSEAPRGGRDCADSVCRL